MGNAIEGFLCEAQIPHVLRVENKTSVGPAAPSQPLQWTYLLTHNRLRTLGQTLRASRKFPIVRAAGTLQCDWRV